MSQLPGYDYSRPNYYMVTLKKLKGLPTFAQITEENAAAIRRRLGLMPGKDLPTIGSCYLVENAVTRSFVDVIRTFHEHWRCIEPIECFSIMPDHLHLLIKIKDVEGRKRLPLLVWQLTKRLEAAYFTVVPGAAGTCRTLTRPAPPATNCPANANPPTKGLVCSPCADAVNGQPIGAGQYEREAAGKRPAVGDGARPHCFAPDWHDWIVKRPGQLAAFTLYIRENPFRAWLRRQNAAYFGSVTTVSFLGREWFAYGNVELLKLPYLCAIKGHRATAEGSADWEKAVATASRIGAGGAGISTFMSPLEKACGRAIGLAGGRWVVLSPEGFGPRWHPGREYERFCAEGRMLFLSLYPAMARQPSKSELYDRCHEMIDLVVSELQD